MPYQITIERGTGSYATSFLLWGKAGAYPQCDGDGTYFGEFPIDSGESEVVIEPDWDEPSLYKYIALPRYMDSVGLPGRIEE